MTKEVVIDCISYVKSKRIDEVYLNVILDKIMDFVCYSEFDYVKVRQFISDSKPTKLGGKEAIEISRGLGFLKSELDIKKKQLKIKL